MDKQYILDFMQECLRIPSVTGDTGRCMEWIEEQFEKLGVETHRTNKGAVYGTIRGEDDDHQVLVNAHVDTLGAMVREILPNGRLRVTNVGGWTYITYEGENLLVHTMDGRTVSGTLLYEKPSVHISPVDAREEVRTEFNMEVRLDEDVHSAADTRALGIEVGDFISFDPKTVLMPNGFIKSRYIDDKACVAILFGVMKQLKEQGCVRCIRRIFISLILRNWDTVYPISRRRSRSSCPSISERWALRTMRMSTVYPSAPRTAVPHMISRSAKSWSSWRRRIRFPIKWMYITDMEAMPV